ncbi:hypothetical protein CUZ92_0804 [Enterococcus faecium]|nr:hypothetical protein [Enterococcus faecium]
MPSSKQKAKSSKEFKNNEKSVCNFSFLPYNMGIDFQVIK